MLPAAEHLPGGGAVSGEQEELVTQLVKHKAAEKKATELVREKPEAVRLHLRAIPYLPEVRAGRTSPAGS